jgi:hypothetical protein
MVVVREKNGEGGRERTLHRRSLLAFSLSLPPVVDVVVSRLGLVCPPYGNKREGEGGRQEKEQEENEEYRKRV